MSRLSTVIGMISSGLKRMRVSGKAGSWLVWVMPSRGSLPKSILVYDPVSALASPFPVRYREYLLDGARYTEAIS